MPRIRLRAALAGLVLAAHAPGALTPARAQQSLPQPQLGQSPISGLDPAPPTPAPSFTGLRGTSADNGLAAPAAGAPLSDALAPSVSNVPGAPNYGKPVPPRNPKLGYRGQAKTAARPLPPLIPYPTSSQGRQKPVPPIGQPVPDPQPAPTIAAAPIILRKPPPKVETDPFAPIGIDAGVGGLRLVPYVEVDTGYASNPNASPTPTGGSWLLRGETGAAIASDWSRHQLTGALELGYNKYFSQPNADRPDGQGKFDLKIDVTRDFSTDFEIRGVLTTQAPGTPGIGSSVVNRPLVATVGATGGGTDNLGNLALGLHGTIDRTIEQNGATSSGAIIDLANGNYTAFGLQPRIAYQLTPGVIPFVEATVDTRKRDEQLDLAGFARDSNGLSARFGTTFELSRILTGQAAVGYAERTYADRRLQSVSAPTIDASLVWTATPLTTATLKAATTINETTVTNSAGGVNHTGSLEIDHALMRNLMITAVGSIGVTNYSGVNLTETTYSTGLKAVYNITRSIAVTGNFTHDRLVSTAPGSDYTANVFLLGLKLQR